LKAIVSSFVHNPFAKQNPPSLLREMGGDYNVGSEDVLLTLKPLSRQFRMANVFLKI
jgi:hypothetical protein